MFNEPTAGYCSEVARLYASFAEARRRRNEDDVAQAEAHLRDAIHLALDHGVGWTDIGAALGMCRGNAYQRFRRRPVTASTVIERSMSLPDEGRVGERSPNDVVVAARSARHQAALTRATSSHLRAQARQIADRLRSQRGRLAA